jgi:hypothetical protein
MINSISSKSKPSVAVPNEKKPQTFGDTKITGAFQDAVVSASLGFQGDPRLTGDRIAREVTAIAAGGVLSSLAGSTGLTVGLHEVVGHGLLGIELTQQSGPSPTYQIVGWDNFKKIGTAGSFKEGLAAFCHWLVPWDQGSTAGVTYHYPDQPNGIGQAMGTEGRDAWISVAGSLPGLALDALSVIGGMRLRKRSPVLGNLMVGFGVMDNLGNAQYPISAALMSDSELQANASGGHDFANFAVSMSDIFGISAHDIAISTAVFWTAFVPILAVAAYLRTRSHIGDVVPDVLALKRWVEKAKKDPKAERELEQYYQSYHAKKRLDAVKLENLPTSSEFDRFLGYLLNKIPSQSLDECKKEILASWEKNLPTDRIQTALAGASASGTAMAVATKILNVLALADSSLQTAATALSYAAPVFIAASVISAGYQVYKDFQCPDSVVPLSAKMLSVAKLILTITCAVLMTTMLFVPGLNLAIVGALVLGAILNILLSYGRSQAIRDSFAFQKAISAEVWNVMYPLWKNHRETKTQMCTVLTTWADCVSKKADLNTFKPPTERRIRPHYKPIGSQTSTKIL